MPRVSFLDYPDWILKSKANKSLYKIILLTVYQSKAAAVPICFFFDLISIWWLLQSKSKFPLVSLVSCELQMIPYKAYAGQQSYNPNLNICTSIQ